MRYSIRFLIKNKVLHYAVFRRYLTFRVLLVFALNMQLTIVSYWVYQLTKDPLSLGLIGLAEVIPAIICSFFSGHFVDQSEKRNLLLLCNVSYLFLSGAFMLLSSEVSLNYLGTSLTLWGVYSCVFIGGVIRAFLGPSSFSMIGLLVPRKLYPNATTWTGLAWQIGVVCGPLLGGFIISWLNYTLSLSCVWLLQFIALFFMLSIPRQPILKKEKEPIFKSLLEGIRFVFKTEIILAVLALDMFAVLFGGPEALLPVFADDILQVGEVGYGWLRAAPGIGAISTLLLLSWVPIKTKAGIKMLVCVAGFGLSTIIFGFSDIFLLSFMMLWMGGMFDAVSVVIRGTILQMHTPDAMRGRVAAVNTMFISSSNELGALESGVAARFLGAVPAVIMGGCITLLVVWITYIKAPILKKVNFTNSPKKES